MGGSAMRAMATDSLRLLPPDSTPAKRFSKGRRPRVCSDCCTTSATCQPPTGRTKGNTGTNGVNPCARDPSAQPRLPSGVRVHAHTVNNALRGSGRTPRLR
jgi:hypothetical protein